MAHIAKFRQPYTANPLPATPYYGQMVAILSHTVRNLPIGEFVCAIRACSPHKLEREFNTIEQRLLKRGYTRKLLNRVKNIALSKNRHQYLFSTTKTVEQPTNSMLTLTTPYSIHYHQITAIIQISFTDTTSEPKIGKHTTGRCNICV